jgi:predicted metal-binding transcription factor (methanogenesis marker protein 9)
VRTVRPGQEEKSLFKKQVYDMRTIFGDLLCCICSKPVPLEDAKTEEHGMAVHEQCYLLKLNRASEDAGQ